MTGTHMPDPNGDDRGEGDGLNDVTGTGAGEASSPDATVMTISAGTADRDYDVTVEFLSKRVRIVRRGIEGDLDQAWAILGQWWGQTDVFAFSGLRDSGEPLGASDRDGIEVALRPAMQGTPFTDGHMLRSVLGEWAVRHLQAEMPGYFTNARCVVAGHGWRRVTAVLGEYTDNIFIAGRGCSASCPDRCRRSPVRRDSAAPVAG